MYRIYYAGRTDMAEDILQAALTEHGEKMRSVRFSYKYMQQNGLDIPFFEKDLEAFGYTHVGSTTLTDMEQIFEAYQGMYCGKEFSDHIREVGATHTSMSVGDLLVEVSTGDLYYCDMSGWTVL